MIAIEHICCNADLCRLNCVAASHPGAFAVLDLPASHYYRQLHFAHPDARFILTVMDAEAWYQRMHKHVTTAATAMHGLPVLMRHMYRVVFGTSNVNKKARWVEAYNQHNANVVTSIPASQLLVVDVESRDAWNQICRFLSITHASCTGDRSGLAMPDDGLDARATALIGPNLHKWLPLRFESHSKFAYVSLIVDPGKDATQRGYFKSFLIAAETIRRTNTALDIVAIVYGELLTPEQEILKREGIKYALVDSIGEALPSNPEPYSDQMAAMMRAKLAMLRLVDYDMILYFDADVMFNKNCDHLFEQYAGNASVALVARWRPTAPIGAGFMLVRPSWQAYLDIDAIASTRMFDRASGWLKFGPIPNWRAKSRDVRTSWSFYASSTDQGLLHYYYHCFPLVPHTGVMLDQFTWDDLFSHFAGPRNKPFGALQSAKVGDVRSELRDGLARWRGLAQEIDERTAKYVQ